jgi:hypothetical protein
MAGSMLNLHFVPFSPSLERPNPLASNGLRSCSLVGEAMKMRDEPAPILPSAK